MATITPTTVPLTIDELQGAPLFPVHRVGLLYAANAAVGGARVSVSLTYVCQTNSKRRIAGRDYLAMPGVRVEAQIGTMAVYRHVDNAENRKLGRVGKPYFKVNTITRSTGDGEPQFANLRPEGITGFVVFMVR